MLVGDFQLRNFIVVISCERKTAYQIDKWFPSTKSCSSCGNTQPTPMNVRTYECSCGLNLDRDYNSALNIKKEGIRLLANA
jgi:putative transposase